MLEVAALRTENAELRAQLTQLIGTIAKLNERVAELLAVAQRKQRKAPAEKAPAAPPVVEGEAKQAFEARPKPPTLEPKVKLKKERPPPTGRKALPSHLPAEEHSLRPDACGHCGSTAPSTSPTRWWRRNCTS